MPRYDVERLGAALVGQAQALTAWATRLAEPDWATASVLPGWTVAVLAGHVVGVLRGVPRLLASPSAGRPRPLPEHFPPETAQPDRAELEREVEAWAAVPGSAVAEELGTAQSAVQAMLRAGGLPAVVELRSGPAATSDVLLTRVWELVVHADDLGRSLPDQPSPELDSGAVRFAVRGLADLLARRAPGRSVELRVPPYAAVQLGQGPRHTRGTPPNVVETAGLTWLRLATGRLSWQAAVSSGLVRASGERSNLGSMLPVLG